MQMEEGRREKERELENEGRKNEEQERPLINHVEIRRVETDG